MASVAKIQSLGKFNVHQLLDDSTIQEICQAHGYRWREAKLAPAALMRQFAWQIAMGNVSCDEVKHHAGGQFSASAYCQARARVPLAVFEALARQMAAEALAKMGLARDLLWRGHRIFRIDGTGITLPDDPLVRGHFGCSGKQKPLCGYPTAHVLLLTGPGGVAVDAICSPLRTGDITHASKTHAHLKAGDLLMGDVLFGTWGHLQQLVAQQLHGLFPLHHSRKIAWGKCGDYGPNRRFVAKLGYRDQLMEYRKPSVCPPWMDRKTYESASQWIRVREVQRQATVGGVRKTITLVTTLLDAKKYPPAALVKLLGERWLIETQIRSLKTTMGLEQLRCQSVDGVKKELMMYLIVYNQLRLLMLQSALRQGVSVERISFADALARLRHGNWAIETALEVVPQRQGRIEPRVVKRRPKAFAVMTRPRHVLQQQLRRQRPAA